MLWTELRFGRNRIQDGTSGKSLCHLGLSRFPHEVETVLQIPTLPGSPGALTGDSGQGQSWSPPLAPQCGAHHHHGKRGLLELCFPLTSPRLGCICPQWVLSTQHRVCTQQVLSKHWWEDWLDPTV